MPHQPSNQRDPPPRTALVLSGGGARGAYQVGVLCGLVEHGFLPRGRSGLEILVGSSAGAINSAALAAHADGLATGLARRERLWTEIRVQQVFRTDLGSLGSTGVRWAWDLPFGGATRRVRAKSLLDTSPLADMLRERLPFPRIEANIAPARSARSHWWPRICTPRTA